MLKRIFQLLILQSIVITSYAANFDQTIQSIMERDIRQFNIPGASLSIYLPDSGVHSYVAGVSHIQKKTPMRKDQLFDIGSMTKLFTSSVILRAVDEKKLTLDTHLSTLAKHYPGSSLAKLVKQHNVLENVTVRELLNHTSGLPAGLNSKAYSKAFAKSPKHYWPPEELVGFALKQKINFKPGQPGHFHYTNTEYLILGIIAHAVNQKPIAQSMRDMVKQLHLKDTHIPTPTKPHFPNKVLSRLTHTYGTPSQGGHSPEMIKTYQTYPAVSLKGEKTLPGYDLTPLLKQRIYSDFPAGGILSTSSDIAHWYHDVFTSQVFSPKQTRQLTRCVPTNAGFVHATLVGSKPFLGITTFCYGLAVITQKLPQYHSMPVHFHGGREPGYIGTNMYLPQYGVSFALLTNLENDYVEDPQNTFSEDIISAIVRYQERK